MGLRDFGALLALAMALVPAHAGAQVAQVANPETAELNRMLAESQARKAALREEEGTEAGTEEWAEEWSAEAMAEAADTAVEAAATAAEAVAIAAGGWILAAASLKCLP